MTIAPAGYGKVQTVKGSPGLGDRLLRLHPGINSGKTFTGLAGDDQVFVDDLLNDMMFEFPVIIERR
jgi:hypothetical protein